MTYLAYDLERVRLLGVAMRTTADELRRLSCDDPLAAAAVSRINLTRLHLDQLWLPLVERITSSDVLATPVDVGGLSLDDVTQALVRLLAQRPGWLLGEVPGDAAGALPEVALTPEQAKSLAVVLQDGDLDELTDSPEERAWLAAQLELLGSDPAAAAAFAAAFDRWGELATVLGQRRQRALDGRDDAAARDEAMSIDRLVGAASRLVLGQYGAGRVAEIATSLDPYDGAVFVSNAGLDAATLSDVSVVLLRRVGEGREGLLNGQWTEDQYRGPHTADILFEAILRTPGAPTAFVIAVQDEPELLWWTASIDELPKLVARVGLDPANISAVDAGDVLHGFVSWFGRLGGPNVLAAHRSVVAPTEYRAVLGDLAVPWFVQYGRMGSEWRQSRATRRADLKILIADPVARAAIFEAAEQATSEVDGREPGYRDATALIEAYGMLLEVDAERKIGEAEQAKASWELSWMFAQQFIGFAAGELGPAAKFVDQAVSLLKQEIDEHGWFNAPRPTGDVEVQAQMDRYRALIASESVTLTAAYLGMRDDGTLAASVPPPPLPTGDAADPVEDYKRRYQQWKEAYLVEGGAAERELDRLSTMFISTTDDGPGAPTG